MDGIIQCIIHGLEDIGIPARRARPGARTPRITEPCAAVGLRRFTAKIGTAVEAELFIQIYTPPALGAAACEQTAASVAAAVAGGLGLLPPCTCRGEECTYDGRGDFFTLRLTMTLPVRLGDEGVSLEQPGTILCNGAVVATVAQWTARVQQTVDPVYAFGENAPVGLSTGTLCYILTLKDVTPARGQNNLAAMKQFSVSLPTQNGAIVYSGCVWREFVQVETETGTSIQAEAAASARGEA